MIRPFSLVTSSMFCGLLLASSIRANDPVESASAAGSNAHQRPKIGLALSGGGAKGIAHVGVLRVLEELRIPVDFIAGTSMGAVAGGLYATGMNAAELEEVVTTLDWQDLLEDQTPRRDLAFRRKDDDLRYLADLELGIKDWKVRWPGGLKSGQKLLFTLQSLGLPAAGIEDFDQLPIPFRAVAANIVDGEMVVLDSGNLAYAIRASMAIPGVFSPVELGDSLLVDGGIVNNIPVDIVAEMGADIVIAVDISGELARREELDSFVKILGQTVALQTSKNEESRLAAADLILRPDVTEFKVLQFNAVDEILARGVATAREHFDDLIDYQLTKDEWQAYLAARPRLPPLPETVDDIRFESGGRVDERIIHARLSERPGEPFDLSQVSTDLGQLYGLGDFELIDFALEEGASGQHTLVIRGQEKPWGPNYMRFGVFFETDLDGDSVFGFIGNLTATRLNRKGAELRTDLKIGTERRILTEFYQPLDFHGGWFVAPRIDFQQNRLDFYSSDGSNVADLDTREFTGAVDIGYQISRFGEFRLGIERGTASADISTGSLPGDILEQIEIDDIDLGGVHFRATFDRLDSVGVPRRGSRAQFKAFLSSEDLGANDDFEKLEVSMASFGTRGRHTLFGALDLGAALDDNLPVYEEFTLGGLLSLSGFRRDELRGQNFGVARLGYYYRLLGSIYGGGYVEAGNVWQSNSDFGEDPYVTATLILATETVAGPVYLALGAADGGSQRVYLSLGRSF